MASPPIPVLVSWSSGKDSAWTVHTLRQQPERYDVRGIFTTVTGPFERVSIHSTPLAVLEAQADRLGLPLYPIRIPFPCPNTAYEAAMEAFLDQVRALPDPLTATHFAFGDLYLEDVRRYREDRLRGTGFHPLFPLWGLDTREYAETVIGAGTKAIVNALGSGPLGREFVGRWYDRQFLADLPPGVDPAGENGEFHTCVTAGPMFSSPIPARPGEIVERSVAGPADDADDGVHRRAPARRTVFYADVVAEAG